MSRARRLVEAVMMSDENFSREFLDAVQIEVDLLELQAYQIDEQTKKSRQFDGCLKLYGRRFVLLRTA